MSWTELEESITPGDVSDPVAHSGGKIWFRALNNGSETFVKHCERFERWFVLGF